MKIEFGFDPHFDVTIDRCDYCGSANDVTLDSVSMQMACPSCRKNLAMMSGAAWDQLTEQQKAEVFTELFEARR